MVTHASNLSTWEVEAGRSGVQSHPQLYNRVHASLVYMRCCLKQQKGKGKESTFQREAKRQRQRLGWQKLRKDTKNALDAERGGKGAPLESRGVWSSVDPQFPCQASKLRDLSSLWLVLSAQTVALCYNTSGNYRDSSGRGGGGHTGCCSLQRCCQDADVWPGRHFSPLDTRGG